MAETQTLASVLAELGYDSDGWLGGQRPEVTLVAHVLRNSLDLVAYNAGDANSVDIVRPSLIRVELKGPTLPFFGIELEQRLHAFTDFRYTGGLCRARFRGRGNGFEADMGKALKEMVAEYDGTITKLV